MMNPYIVPVLYGVAAFFMICFLIALGKHKQKKVDDEIKQRERKIAEIIAMRHND